ncbi:hypothetical protein [Photorhabdus heterorhabditis]|uniref:hypothetical protein n=1 Tax=Photorhabdus heterorhabditis TaxID=880156 RepID=UPI001561E8FA|nr:hypothetical protein [Photorhabdus heterorhabditis]NRN27594.1 hypothetical protein [Photorhabdus heterorhabditis subsp. aluminescens]
MSDTSRAHKFIFNERGQLAIGSISKKIDPKMLSHPALAVTADRSSEVLSAGYLYRRGNTIYTRHLSGWP